MCVGVGGWVGGCLCLCSCVCVDAQGVDGVRHKQVEVIVNVLAQIQRDPVRKEEGGGGSVCVCGVCVRCSLWICARYFPRCVC